jgi:RNA polymerase subunit RPABC4/transcription elongation factor Spt4
VIEIRSDIAEQIIEAQLKIGVSSNQLSPSRGGSLDSKHGALSTTLVVVMCTKCHSRFAEGVKFCGRCGNTTFQPVSGELKPPPVVISGGVTCPRCHQEYTATKVLRTMWNSDWRRRARLAHTETGRSFLSRM